MFQVFLIFMDFLKLLELLFKKVDTFSKLNWKIKRSNLWHIIIHDNNKEKNILKEQISNSNNKEETIPEWEDIISDDEEETIPEEWEDIISDDKKETISEEQEETISEEQEDIISDDDEEFIPEEWKDIISDDDNFSLSNSDEDNMETKNDTSCFCKGPAIQNNLSLEEKVCALITLGFDVATLDELDFQVYFVDLQPQPCIHFLKSHHIDQYLQIGNKNTLVISLNTSIAKNLLVCAIIVTDISMMEKKKEYGEILNKIQKYCRRQKRGEKKHPCIGNMYAYGYRSERKTSDSTTIEEKNHYAIQLENIVKHYSNIFCKYLPQQAKEAFEVCAKFHAPTIANTHVGNFTITHNFQSAPHTDPDMSYAFGVWYNYGRDQIKGGEFVFPDYRVSIKLHDGICIAWNSIHAKHATVACKSYNSTRIGTSIQLNRTLAFKANRMWKQHH